MLSVSRLCLVVVAARPMLIAAVMTPKQKITFNTRFVAGFICTPHKRKTGISDVVRSMTHDKTVYVSLKRAWDASQLTSIYLCYHDKLLFREAFCTWHLGVKSLERNTP